MEFAEIPDIIEDLRAGKMTVLVDDENRENEGDLVCAAELTRPDDINFMATYGKGWICLTLDGETCDRLDLPQMVGKNTAALGTAFTITIEAREGVTTGISAADRAHTINVAARADSRPQDFVRPGHVQPIRAREGGVMVRTGQTEGSVDLMRLAGLRPAGVICEIMNDDGTMARLPQLEVFCNRHGLKLTSVAKLIEYRRRTEKLIRCAASVDMPTTFGHFRLHDYFYDIQNETHLALTLGEDLYPGAPASPDPVLTRVHSECLTGDVFHSLRCDCGEQLQAAMRMVAHEGRGIILYMRQEGRGIGLENKLKAYELQERGMDTVEANVKLGFPADLRDYGLGAQMLSDLGATKLRLITNNPKKIAGLSGYGLEIVERVPLRMEPHNENARYLETKRTKLGHLLAEDIGVDVE
ncbi:MAG: bifunctional 3,4-dihydroxy-2-butanone-4-phosphate synthase/GTP cyclohydrolase II [Planctomycetota bacterium]|jgi:3,4-dihydroxy 2-butanone 4-phosphate synthase/GTP cyclohydrolase II|nr:bifunctional 3,4-dihydroxy-2-butanone-4-phosphate synthase/GTP cyclohydrolase II [Planctomycetota bacterium]